MRYLLRIYFFVIVILFTIEAIYALPAVEEYSSATGFYNSPSWIDNSIFKWFRTHNGVQTPLNEASGSAHTVVKENINEADFNSKYYYTITNPEAPNLTLHSSEQTFEEIQSTTCSSTLEQEYQALMALYQSTNGVAWTNNTGWRDANPNIVQNLIGWHGVTTDAQGHVTVLNLQANNLTGSIPTQIGSLCYIKSLTLSNNKLDGILPDEFGYLASMEACNLSDNKLVGALPSTLGGLIKLTYLHLGQNQFSGFIPVSIGGLANLTELYLHSNSFIGEIPSSMGNLNKLKYLNLSTNSFSSSIPPSIGNLTALVSISMTGNQLTGGLPAEFSNLTNLETADLSNNKIDGALPSAIGNLTKLTYLHLGQNNFSGVIPISIGGMTNLTELYLHSNNFIGEIPSSLGNLNKLKYLNLSTNSLSSSIPPSIGNLIALVSVSMTGNQLTGWLPAEFSNLVNLETANLSNNKIAGALPSAIGNLTKLTYLHLGQNNLSGVIPTSIGGMTNLIELYLHHNGFTGEIPSSIGNLNKLKFLNLSQNSLASSIPSTIGNLSALRVLYMQGNQLTGTLPVELGQLISLEVGDFSNNKIDGMLPASLSNLTKLRDLNISGNKLSGPIHVSLASISTFTDLIVSNNAFTFSDILPAKSIFSASRFQYQGQQVVDAERIIQAVAGQSVTLTTSIDIGTNPSSIFKWFRIHNGVQTPLNEASSSAHTVVIENISEANFNSKYYYMITNPEAPDLTLYSKEQTLEEIPSSTCSPSDAGPNQSVCGQAITLTANTPTVGTGIWTLVSGPITTDVMIQTPASATTLVSVPTEGLYVFRWSISNLNCISSDDVSITFTEPPFANAGTDQTVCGLKTTLNGNEAFEGVAGSWTQVSGPANGVTIETSTSPRSKVIVTTPGVYEFRWMLTYFGCVSDDVVSITFVSPSTIANAGPDQTTCELTTSLGGNIPINGIGVWTQVSGPTLTTIVTPSASDSKINVSESGVYEFSWSISKEECPVSSDKVVVTFIKPVSMTIDLQFINQNMTYYWVPILHGLEEGCTVSYSWDFGDGVISKAINPTHTYAYEGSMFVKLKVLYTCLNCPSREILVSRTITVVEGEFCDNIYCDDFGNVSVGINNGASGYKLSVAGKMIVGGLQVALKETWPDYVFEKDYKLMSLSELKEYINSNKHLPNIPSSESIKKTGLDAGEMSSLLLQKMEEITLYLINLDERLREIEKKEIE